MSQLNAANPDNIPDEIIHLEPSDRPVRFHNTLTAIQSGSALVFSTVAVTHTIAILLAPVGGIDLSNRYMILGRVYYQDGRISPILLAGGLGLHVLSGLGKAALRWKSKSRLLTPHHDAVTSTSPLPYHREVGYALIPLFAIHYRMTRVLPYEHLHDPSYLDFSYISYTLHKWPILSYTFHLTWASLAAYHAVSGAPLVWQRLFGKRTIENAVKPEKTYAAAVKNTTEIEHRKIKTERSRKVRYGIVGGLVGGFATALAVFARNDKVPLKDEYAKILGGRR